MPKTISFRKWIDEYGVRDLAAATGVFATSVWQWRRGYSIPSHDAMYQVLKLAKGRLTYERIVKDYFSAPNNKNRWNHLRPNKRKETYNDRNAKRS